MIGVRTQVTMTRQEMAQIAALTQDGGFGIAGGMVGFLASEKPIMLQAVRDNVERLGSGTGPWKPLSPAYQARKAAGKTPGGGRFGVPAMLRDSGKGVASIQAVVDARTMSIRLEVPETARYLVFHFDGAGRNPVRNPLSDDAMRAYTDGFERRLNAHLSGAINSVMRQRGGSVDVVRAAG